MPNRPEYLAIWLGIAQIGGVVALLNTNLTGAALAHCIAIAAPAHIVVAGELRRNLSRRRARIWPPGRKSGATAKAPWRRRASTWPSTGLDGADLPAGEGRAPPSPIPPC